MNEKETKIIRQKKQKIKIIVGIIITVSGTALMIYDWNTGSGHFEYAYSFSIFYLLFLMSIIGAFVVLYNRKSNLPNNPKSYFLYLRKSVLYSVAYPILLASMLYGYSYLYIFPKIETEKFKTKAIITKAEKGFSSDHYGRLVDYEYNVNGRIYKRRIFNKKLNEGDSVLIFYYNNKPNFHVVKDIE